MKSKKWIPEEVSFLEENYHILSLEEISTSLNRTVDSVMKKGKRLGLTQECRKWTLEEIDCLKKNYNILSLDEICIFLNRPKNGIQKKAKQLGLTEEYKKWTPEEISFLEENYESLSIEEIASLLSRTRDSVFKKAKSLGLTQEIKNWTPEEEEFLIEHWGYMQPKRLSKTLGRSMSGIKKKAYSLGLCLPKTASGFYLTSGDIAYLLGKHQPLIYRWLRDGKIKSYKYNDIFRVSVDDFLKFIEEYQDKWNAYYAETDTISSYYTEHARVTHKTEKFTVKTRVPKWFEEKIKLDYKNNCIDSYKKWTQQEENLLNSYIRISSTVDEMYSLIKDHINRSRRSILAKAYKLQDKYNFSIVDKKIRLG